MAMAAGVALSVRALKWWVLWVPNYTRGHETHHYIARLWPTALPVTPNSPSHPLSHNSLFFSLIYLEMNSEFLLLK